MPPPNNVDERAPLLAHQAHDERTSAVAVFVPSSFSVTEVEIPNQEAPSHQRTLDFKLFRSLLVDSIPGKNHHPRFERAVRFLSSKHG